MTLARRRPVALAAFALLALLAEMIGRSATLRVDGALSVRPLATPTTAYYPFLLAGVKLAATLAAGALALRIVRAHTTAAGAERLLATIGRRPGLRPRLRVRLSLRLWLAAFATTALWYLLETSADQMIDQRRPLLAAWLHTYALPVFVVLSLLVALAWAVVSDWLSDVEGYTTRTLARAKRVLGRVRSLPRPRPDDDRAPRHLFGVVFASRPPPLPSLPL
jgi:hypothetical protein